MKLSPTDEPAPKGSLCTVDKGQDLMATSRSSQVASQILSLGMAVITRNGARKVSDFCAHPYKFVDV